MPHPVTSKKHLRVRTPQTTDGTQLRLDDENKVIFKTRFLPLTAKAALERENNKLPKNLRHIIDEVPGDSPESRKTSQQRRGPAGPQKTAKPADENLDEDDDADSGGEDDVDVEELLKLAKPDLQSKYGEKFGERPANNLTKEQLAEAIVSGQKIE